MILTENKLRQAAQDAKRLYLTESYDSDKLVIDAINTYDIFISHSFREKELVSGLYYLFSEAGYKVKKWLT